MGEFKYIGGNGDTIVFDCYCAIIKKTNVCGTICARFDNGIRKDLTGDSTFLILECKEDGKQNNSSL